MLPLSQLINFVESNALFTAQERILLAVSGGKDSVLMAHLFKLAGYQFSIAHCNFNLRDEESERDEAFVKQLSSSLDVPFYLVHFDTEKYANEHQLSIQMAARSLRYDWFETIRNAGGYKFVALAHHQNDSVETVLLNLTRGTGISGMHGILPKRDHFIRPMLCFTRQQIDYWIAEYGFDFVEDSSNGSAKYARNNIRLNVIPHLRKINPNLEATFAANIERFRQTEEVLQQMVEQVRTNICSEVNSSFHFSISQIKALRPQQLLFYELLKPFEFTADVANEILMALEKQSGTSFYSMTYCATINRDVLIVSTIAKSSGQTVFVGANDPSVKIGNHQLSVTYTSSTAIDGDPLRAFVDHDLLIFPLLLRFKQNGDRFMPFGMKQFKKLSDFFIQQKIPLPEKDNIPILVNGNGEIIWVAGLRQDNRYKVNATTKKVAIFELSNQYGSKI